MWKIALLGLLLLACAGCIAQQKGAVKESPTPYESANLAGFPSPSPSPSFASPVTTPSASETSLLPTSDLINREPWIGQPTYPESEPGLNFRLEYDPTRWERAENAMGLPTLIHRMLASCVIAPAVGRGLSFDLVVDQSFQLIGNINFEVNTVSRNGVVQYINYFGGDGSILTGFQVSFERDMTNCVSEAESVLTSLTSIPESP